ncbi:hypothetical protein BHE74_00044350 [Ensete ventricosum]|nr:hypothetical protein BHE74_00044350 [Ensete ventricosum]
MARRGGLARGRCIGMDEAEVIIGQRKRVWRCQTWRSGPGGLDGRSDQKRPQSLGQGHAVACKTRAPRRRRRAVEDPVGEYRCCGRGWTTTRSRTSGRGATTLLVQVEKKATTKASVFGVAEAVAMWGQRFGKEEEPSAEVACSRVDGRRLDWLCIRANPGDHVEEARGWWNSDVSVRNYRWTAMWRTDSVGAVVDKGRGRWQRGDLDGRKRRFGGYSKRSRGCSISIALHKKTRVTPKDHERLRARLPLNSVR